MILMKEYESIDEIAKVFFTTNQYGFDDWVVVKITELKTENIVLITLANPISNDIKQVGIKHYSDVEIENFRNTYRQHYIDQLGSRFGFFIPDINTGDVEYDNFDLFKHYWIENDSYNVIPYNIPLLFDFPNNVEYAEAVQDGMINVNYQRLIAIVAQPRKKRIKTLFIKNVTEKEIDTIKSTLIAKTNEVKDRLFA